MIVYYNVCDQCGNQNQIDPSEDSDNKGFEFAFSSQDLVACLEKDRFKTTKMRTATFCDRECMLEFLKVNISESGQIKEKA